MQRLRAFTVSWFFAPYLGSADLDFFKRIKDTHLDYRVVQLRRDVRDDGILRFVTHAGLERLEVDTDFRNPRTRRTRDAFRDAALAAFGDGRGYDVLISHSNEIASHAVAYELKKRQPRMPWVAYFGDLFIRNPYLRYIKDYPLVPEDNQTEIDTLTHADLVICNNDYQADLMFTGDLARFRHKAVTIPHCYDPAMYDPAPPASTNQRFTIAHLGTLYHVKRTAEPVLRAVDRLVEIYPAYRGAFEVLFYGGAPCANDLSVHAFMRQRGHVRFEEPVGYLASLRLMQAADALLLIDGIFDPAEDGLDCNPFLAGKLPDYMGAGKPIIGVTMAKGPSADLLRESRNLTADTRIDRIAYVLKRTIDRKVQPDLTVYQRFHSADIGAAMEAAIRRVVKEAS